MNICIFSGRLTKDPDVRYAAGATEPSVARFRIAIPRDVSKDSEPKADFATIVCFKNRAKFTEKYLKKGVKIEVRCSLRTDNYVDQGGATHYTQEYIAQEIEFAESKKSSENAAQGAANAAAQADTAAKEPAEKDDGFANLDFYDEDLPFE